MLSLSTALPLPNFIKTTILITTTVISFGALAADQEEAPEAAVERVSELSDTARGAIDEAHNVEGDANSHIKEMTEETDDLEKTVDLMSQ